MNRKSIPVYLALLFVIVSASLGQALDDSLKSDSLIMQLHLGSTRSIDGNSDYAWHEQEIQSRFLEAATKALEGREATLGMLFDILIILMAIFATLYAFLAWERFKANKEIQQDLGEARRLRLQIEEMHRESSARVRSIADMLQDVKNASEKSVRVGISKARAQGKYLPHETIKFINESDAQQSIEAYEQLIFSLETSGHSVDLIPVSLHKVVGQNYFALRRYDKALHEFDLYLRQNRNDVDALFTLGVIFGQLHEPSMAIEIWQRVTEISPGNDMAYANWAGSLVEEYQNNLGLGLIDEAIEKAMRATEINNQNTVARINWAAALTELYRHYKDTNYLKQADEKCREAISINSNDALSRASRSTILLESFKAMKGSNLLKDAIYEAEYALKIDPQNDGAYANLACAHLFLFRESGDKSQLQSALGYASRSLGLRDTNPAALYNVACALALFGRKQEMLERLEKAINLSIRFKREAKSDADFERYWGDADFIKLTKE